MNNLEFIFTLIFCFIIPMTIFIKPIIEARKNKKSLIDFLKENKIRFILLCVLIIGSLVRIVGIDKIPNALNADEASSGYDAYAIMKYGMDRAGNSYPIELYAWGSGQSVLYSYIMIPFIAIGGLSVYTMRLPMALIGIASLYMIYYLLKNMFEKEKISLIAVTFLAICPWHIMKSRWGMECNIFPDLILLATLLIVLGVKYNKKVLQILAFVVFGLSSYAYGTAYMFLPIYVLGVLIYLNRKEDLSIKRAMAYLGIVFVVALPMIIYVIINTFGLEPIKIGITIPILKYVRYMQVSSIFQGNILLNCTKNLNSLFHLLTLQYDTFDWNALPEFGMFYHVSIIFMVMGFVIAVTKYKENKYNQIMNIWLLACFILALFLDNNINRINIIIIPCIYYTILGLDFITEKHKIITVGLIVMYTVFFVLFMRAYCQFDSDNNWTFAKGMDEVIEYCENSDAETIYCIVNDNEPYIYFLFYNEFDVNTYIKTVELKDPNGTFRNIKSFDKYRFYVPENIEENTIVIVPTGIVPQYEQEIKNKTTIYDLDIYEY